MKNKVIAILWDLWCILSIIGLWPRFIEPQLIKITKLTLNTFPKELEGLKIIHFTDLHFSKRTHYLGRVKKKILALKPDLILFTGDLLSYGTVENKLLLQNFLQTLSSTATYGAFASLGNHDYEKYISRNHEGDFDISSSSAHFIVKSLQRLFAKKNLHPQTSARARALKPNLELQETFKKSAFHLLNNESRLISIQGTYLNLTGLGDYWAGQCLAKHAFQNYNSSYPGIVLSHNPDSYPLLESFPGELILSGHTHGGQVNLPFITRAIAPTNNPKMKKGLFNLGNKKLYINRGIGSHHPFRWFSPPEILLIKIGKP